VPTNSIFWGWKNALGIKKNMTSISGAWTKRKVKIPIAMKIRMYDYLKLIEGATSREC